MDLLNLSRDEKVSFFINVYNALVVHAFVVQGPPNNLWKRFRVSEHGVSVAHQYFLTLSLCVCAHGREGGREGGE